ncbi:Uncharacterised protein [Mycobacterium tuberculosis]|nr:Uncharacterised protein [Mycobacterium tuberculosis]
MRRPITIVCPMVISRKCAWSSGKRQGMSPPRPMTPDVA